MKKIISKLNWCWWRFKYLMLDTKHGRITAICTAVSLMFLVVVLLIDFAISPPDHQTAFPWLTLAIALVSSLLVFALMPKVEPPKPQESNVPKVKDGAPVIVYFGTVWPELTTLGQQRTGTQPIKAKGGKK